MTAADAASSTTETPKRKGWVDRTDAEEARMEAQDGRDAAAEKTGRKGRRSPLYDEPKKSDTDSETEGTTALKKRMVGAPGGFLYDTRKDQASLDSMKVSREVPRRKAADEED